MTNSTTNYAAGVSGYEGATSGQVFGVIGSTASQTNYAAGVDGAENATTGAVFGVNGYTQSTTNGAAGVNGNEGATSGVVYGVSGSDQQHHGQAPLALTATKAPLPARFTALPGSHEQHDRWRGWRAAGMTAATTGRSFWCHGKYEQRAPAGLGVDGYARRDHRRSSLWRQWIRCKHRWNRCDR